MSAEPTRNSRAAAPVAFMLAGLVAATGGLAADANRNVDLHRPAEPQGTVEIQNVAGSVDVQGWDRAEVAVTGRIGERVERIDIATAAGRTTIHVVRPEGTNFGGNSEADLVVHVPRKSRVSVSVVSADIRLSDLQGNVELQATSGDITGEVGGDVRISTVSGEVQLSAPGAHVVEIKSISGDVTLTGAPGGEINVTTVSGDAQLQLGAVGRGRFKTVSGEVTVALAFAGGGQFEASSVSGDLRVEFAGTPDAEIDAETMSGDISSCFGEAWPSSHAEYGPGSRLSFKSGAGKGRVRLETKSGDISLCHKASHAVVEPPRSIARPVALAANAVF
jgi:DUF4097 and DUF4098 domain-containing protein YvlB